MRGSARLAVIGALVASALTSCVVTFEDYPVSGLDAGADASSGSGGSQAGASGWAALGGVGGVDASGGVSGSSAGSAGMAGNGGASGAGAGGVGGGGGFQCDQYVYGMVAGVCHAFESITGTDFDDCMANAGPGTALVTCDAGCVNSNSSTCLKGAPVAGATVASVCVLNAPGPGCQPQCLNQVDYHEALSASCDENGACDFSKTNCGNYRCDPSTNTCKTSCKESLDCVSLLQCVSGVCTSAP
jgi:hypothetical protein